MQKTVQTITIFSALALALAACSAKVSGNGSSPDIKIPSIDEGFAHKITGPEVSGSWSSDCVFDDLEEKYHVKRISFVDNKVERVVTYFSDMSCEKKLSTSDLRGFFRWVDVTSYGGYLMDYRFDLGNGGYSMTAEEILIENGKLYLSDFRSGFGQIDKSVQLTKKTNAEKPNPSECPVYSGIFYRKGYYTQLSQEKCDKLFWQGVDSSGNPTGYGEVYFTDGKSHSVGGKTLKSYYQNQSWLLEFYENSYNYKMVFQIVNTDRACNTYLSGKKSVLVRRTFMDGMEVESKCIYWEKVK